MAYEDVARPMPGSHEVLIRVEAAGVGPWDALIRAASIPVIALTAWQMLFDYAKIQPRQRVLILGASGNVGSMAIQLAQRHQAYTIALTCPETSS